MAFLSDDLINEKVESPDNLVNRLTIHQIVRGNQGTPNLPMEIRKTVAILTNEGERPSHIAEEFGISPRSAGLIRDGRVTPDGYLKPELQSVIASTKTGIQASRATAESAAISNLLDALSIIPGEIAKKTPKPKVLASIAKDMAVIANQMADKNTNPDGSKAVHLHIYAPRQKTVEEYEVIDV